MEWVVSILLKKFSQNRELLEDDELWTLLQSFASSPKFEASFISVTKDNLWDFLNNSVDHLNQCKNQNLPAEWIASLFRNHRQIRSTLFKNPDTLNHFAGRCLQNDFIVEDVIWLYQTAISLNNGNVVGSNFDDVLLPKLLIQDNPDATKIISRELFGREHASCWSASLKSMLDTNEDEGKFRTKPTFEKMFFKVSHMGHTDQIKAVKTLFKAALQSSLVPDQSKALFFALFCNILQVFPISEEITQLTPIAKAVLPKLEMDAKMKLPCLKYLTDCLIEARFDFTILLIPSNETSTFMKFLQHWLKYLIDNFKNDHELICSIAVDLASYSPLVTEPLIGNLSMSIMALSEEIRDDFMSRLFTLYFKLRQMPKLIARMLITMGKGNHKEFLFSAKVLDCFADKVSKLPVGQLLELWKTFEFHMKNTSDLTAFIDQIMSVFIINACLIEQSIPESTMDKIKGNIESTLALDLNQNPKVLAALNEMSVLLKHSRGLEIKLRNEEKWASLQKRKLESIEEVTPKKSKIELKWDDLKSLPESSWISLLTKLDDFELTKAVDDICNSSVTSQNDLFEEEPRILDILFNKVIKAVSKKSKYLKKLETNNLQEIADNFEEISVDEENLKILSFLPLEHVQGNLETKLSLFFLSSCNSSPTAKNLLARTLFNGFRSSSILKFMSVESVLQILTAKETASKQDELCIRLICKAAVTYGKPLGEIDASLSKYSESLESLNNEPTVLVATSFLESVRPVLTSKVSTSDEKKAKCQNIFKTLSKSLLKGMKNSENIEIDENILLEGLTTIITTQCCQEDKKQLKKWSAIIKKYVATFVASKEKVALDFMSAVLENYEMLSEKLDQEFFQLFFKADFHQKTCENEVELSVLRLLLQASSEHDQEFFINFLEKLTINTFSNPRDLKILKNWSALIKAKISNEDMLTQRKEFLTKLMGLFTQQELNHETLCSYYIPMMEFHENLLESDKPLLNRESEAFCVSQSITLDLNEVLSKLPDNFEQMWTTVFRIISNAFHKRPSSLVITRIPVIANGLRNLLFSLATASDQKRTLEPSEIKVLVTLAYNFDRLCEHMKKLKDEFARVAPYILADVMDAFQKVTLYPNVRSNFLHGVHKLLDICDTHSIDYLTAVLPSGKQEMFKHIFTNYKQYHRYAGKV